MPPFNVPSGMEAMDTDSTSSELSKMMESELAKGSDSTVPQDTLASIGALRDYLTGTATPTRAGYDQAVGQDLSDITQRKQDLIKRLSSGDQLTASQTMGLAILALGLAAAGGAAKGKLGLAAAGNAFNVGGQVFLKQSEDENKVKRAIGLQQLGDLNKAQTSLTGELAKSKMGDVTDQEKIDYEVNKERALVKAELKDPTAGKVPNAPNPEAQKSIVGAKDTIDDIDSFKQLIQEKYPVQLQQGESSAAARARVWRGQLLSSDDQKYITAELSRLVKDQASGIGNRLSGIDMNLIENMAGGKNVSIQTLDSLLDRMKVAAERHIRNEIDTARTIQDMGGFKGGLTSQDLGGLPSSNSTPPTDSAPTIGDNIRARSANNSAQSAPPAPAKAPVTPATPAGSKTSYSVTLKDGSTRTVGSAFEVQQLIDQGLL